MDPFSKTLSAREWLALHHKWQRDNPGERQSWEYWDTKTGKPASMFSAPSRYMAMYQIKLWRERDERAGNPARSANIIPRRVR